MSGWGLGDPFAQLTKWPYRAVGSEVHYWRGGDLGVSNVL